MKQTILITGASGNLGQVVIKKLTDRGDTLLATFSPGRVKSQSGVHAYEADLASEASAHAAIQRMLADHTRIHAGVLTVGGFAAGAITETTLDGVNAMLQLNFNTAYTVARPLFLHMAEQGGGRIVFIGARPGIHSPSGKHMVAYALSKAMIFKLAELLNEEGKSKNVVCSVIVPSIIDTPANRESMPTADPRDWVTPEEIADAVAYLTSEEGRALREPVLKMYNKA